MTETDTTTPSAPTPPATEPAPSTPPPEPQAPQAAPEPPKTPATEPAPKPRGGLALVERQADAIVTLSPLAFEPTNIAEVYTLAATLVEGGGVMVGGGRDKRPATKAEVATLILVGRERGLRAMQATQGLFLVDGRVGAYTQLLLGMVISNALCVRCQLTVSTRERAVWVLHRRGWEPSEFEFTEEDARDAGLIDKWNYKAYRRDMLAWRALSRGIKFTFADVIGGLGSVEEMIEAIDLKMSADGSYGVDPEVARREANAADHARRVEAHRVAEETRKAPPVVVAEVVAPEKIVAEFKAAAQLAGAKSKAQISEISIEIAGEADPVKMTPEQRANVIAAIAKANGKATP